ncbi:ribosome maturation factor RimP [Hydrogenovibrio sp. JE_KL2]|uniref:ribosome maturation factor RimP n=1 Tax=Hydrogenovibrio sp. JE_KL2 TaxID=2651188 RepID=UPI001353A1F1|nr:ribosome maturation factor RimP [Thiotrichales bacterium]MBN2605746.1 ribosome maturation factor RimP [Thiotrichales bacterium]MPQ75921.1 ribosome maturation factor RimP [Hydrogenovibrio sp. JE_KL2]
MTLEDKIEQLLKPTVETMGFDFWGCEYLPAGQHSTLRIYIDKPEGVTVDDCGSVSRQVSAILDVEDPISSAYMLEVSSPGLDRPLMKPEQFQDYVDAVVQVRTSMAVMGRKRFKGKMVRVEQDGIEVDVDNEIYPIPFNMIEKANVVPEF